MKFRFLLPSTTKLRQGNIFTGVCQSFCSQEGGVSQHALGQTSPPGQTPSPLGRHPLDRHRPGPIPHGQNPPWADTPSWADTPLPTATTAEVMHPTGMHSCCVVFLLLWSSRAIVVSNYWFNSWLVSSSYGWVKYLGNFEVFLLL